MTERIHIDRCPVDCLTPQGTLALLREAIQSGRHIAVAPVYAATVVEAHRNAALREALEAMDVLLPDGFYLRPAARALRLPAPAHVPTVPLTLALLDSLARGGGSVYLLGARAEVVREAAVRVGRRFPGIHVVGTRDGYFSEAEEADVVREINAAHPDLLLVGISSPRRDLFLARHRAALATVAIGVGGLMDILGGKTPEGPNWLRRIGMMWLYRLAQEPRRLLRRYTMDNLAFISLVARQAIAPRGRKQEERANRLRARTRS